MKNLEEKINNTPPLPDMNTDPFGYYEWRYKGVTRGRLKLIDGKLYRRLYNTNSLERVPVCRAQKPRKNYGKDLLQYYRDNHAGITRTKLRDLDSAFHQRLRRAKLIKDVPLAYRSFNGDPFSYYLENYCGLTQGELRKIDPSLYQILWRKKALNDVPK